jgi:hypothetical protein
MSYCHGAAHDDRRENQAHDPRALPKKSVAGRARGDMKPAMRKCGGFVVFGPIKEADVKNWQLFLARQCCHPMIRLAYIWHHKSKADGPEFG